ncbi:MAG: AAA domain-containing protein, partial [Thiolinea sp.]
EISAGCYADPDTMDLKPFYDKALDDIAESVIGREVVLPLLAGQLNASYIFEDNYDDAADMAEEAGCNEQQIDAVGKGVAAQYLACIQGPPGTGKTRVISLIAQQLVAEGHRVLLTSHTHMAINNALNKVAATGVPLVKVGAHGCLKGLDSEVPHVEYGNQWREQPDGGYVIGATPFATCSSRLENFQFDTVIFDEASQVTVPLALMAMRKAKRFVFVGDHQQLPPVVLSAPVLAEHSVFGRLVAAQPDSSVMLTQTYRMCQALARWPSAHYYSGRLVSVGPNAARQFSLLRVPQRYVDILSEAHPLVFIRSPGVNTRQVNRVEAQQVGAIVEQAVAAGLKAADIGVVTPFRSHAKALKTEFARRNIAGRREIVTDTVERMQGQEREMIILSLCATDPQYLTAIAAFFFQAQRLNVAITRPQTKLIVFGPVLDKGFVFDCDDAVLLRQISDYRSLLAAAWHAPVLEAE